MRSDGQPIRANPHVFGALVRLCRATRDFGIGQWSAKAAFEVLRWSYSLHTRGETFKLNNNYTSRYARMVMDECAELRGFFQLRELKAE